LPIADCRWSIEELVWQLLPMPLSNRKSAIPAILDEAMMVENLRRTRRRYRLVQQRGPVAATKSRFFAPLRSALQKLDALLVSIEQLGPSLSEPSSPRN
jgi:hypothetical protein